MANFAMPFGFCLGKERGGLSKCGQGLAMNSLFWQNKRLLAIA
jgi:hypothetical protein